MPRRACESRERRNVYQVQPLRLNKVLIASVLFAEVFGFELSVRLVKPLKESVAQLVRAVANPFGGQKERQQVGGSSPSTFSTKC